jgi:hypothetical protein
MDFSKYKFVVSSGCSYGRLADAVFGGFNGRSHFINPEKLLKEFGQSNWLDIDGDEIISLNLSLGSQGSDWQSDSLIYAVERLLELGVKTENIYCLVEWSQWHRYSVHPPHHYGLDMGVFNFRKRDEGVRFEFEYAMTNKTGNMDWEVSNNVLDFFRNHFDLSRSNINEFHNIGKIEDRIYMTLSHMSQETFHKMGDEYKLFYDHIIEVENNLPVENKIKSYLDNILRTQYFLQKHNLKYNFCFMQSTLTDWGHLDSGVLCHPLFNLGMNQYVYKNEKLVFNTNFNPVNNSNSDIENIMPDVRTKMNQIDFDNFWMYENERFRRGGIDEWTIDNLKETGYVNINQNKLDYNFRFDEIIPNYGEHPNMVAYVFLWNKITFNCNFVKVKPEFEKFLWEKYWEDYNYDGITKNNITLSKSEWNRIFENIY